MKRSRIQDTLMTDFTPKTPKIEPSDKEESEIIPNTSREDKPNIKKETITESICYPPIWSAEQWLERREKHKWLSAKNGYLGCMDCASMTTTGSQGLTLSSEWINFTVNFNGTDRTQQLKSLRTKISAHQLSKAHQQASLILAEANKYLENPLRQQEADMSKLEKIFNTAYYIAKHDKPFSDFEDLMQLQIMNGLEMEDEFPTHYNVAEIVNYIASKFKTNLTTKLVAEERKISIVVDESSELGSGVVLIVYIKIVFGEGEEELMFLDLISLSGQSAEAVATAILNCLDSYGMTETYLQKNLICFASDGASVLLGKASGVGKLLQDKLKTPEIIIWHCLNHRLELTGHDTVAGIDAINHFESFIDTIYYLWNLSCKNMDDLKGIASNLDVELSKTGLILNAEWTSSSFQCVHSVWTAYRALFDHFKQAASDQTRTTNERKKYTSLFQQMESVEFLKDLSLMHDVLEELANLSMQLQEQFCTITRADKLIRRTVRIIGAMKDKPGETEKRIMVAKENMSFQGIALKNNKKVKNINRQQFITGVVKNLESRCFVAATSNRKPASNDSDAQRNREMLKEFEVLNPEMWPEDIDFEEENNILYGVESIKKMCARFRLENSRLILNGFWDFFEGGGRKVPANLAELVNTVNTIPRNTSECERTFIAMNQTVAVNRTEVLVPTVSTLVFIKINGPPVALWNATPFVRSWVMQQCHDGDRQSEIVNVSNF